jgi:hypothetical protein
MMRALTFHLGFSYVDGVCRYTEISPVPESCRHPMVEIGRETGFLVTFNHLFPE